MLTPSGYVEVVEVRAPNEAMALDTVQYWKPCHQVATDPLGNPLIWAVQALAPRGDAAGPAKSECRRRLPSPRPLA
jgi:hypothetical protein